MDEHLFISWLMMKAHFLLIVCKGKTQTFAYILCSALCAEGNKKSKQISEAERAFKELHYL